MSKFLQTFVLLIALCGCQRLKPLTIQTGQGDVVYRVEVASTDAERIKGLMWREHLRTDSGMIFLFSDDHPQPVAMWMKNTLISLDMLFLSKDFKIIGIVQNTKPMSLEMIRPTTQYVVVVIELNAGQVKEHGIKLGNQVIFDMPLD